MSRRSKCSTTASVAARTALRERTSQSTPSPRSSPRSSPRRESSPTDAPASWNLRATAAPIPPLAPVTSATFPSSSMKASSVRRLRTRLRRWWLGVAEHALAEVPQGGSELLAGRRCLADARPARLGKCPDRVLVALGGEDEAAIVLREQHRHVELAEQIADRLGLVEVRLPDLRGDLHRRKAGHDSL